MQKNRRPNDLLITLPQDYVVDVYLSVRLGAGALHLANYLILATFYYLAAKIDINIGITKYVRFHYLCDTMKIEEAIVYLLATSGHGMKIDQIAREINQRRLFIRRDNAPVDGKMVYAVVMAHPEMFCKSEGRIRLLM